MSTRVVSVAALCVLLFASPALVGCSSSHHAARSSAAQPRSRLIVLGQSIAGIRLGEPRKSVEKAFSPGRSGRRGLVRYFEGDRLRAALTTGLSDEEHQELEGRIREEAA